MRTWRRGLCGLAGALGLLAVGGGLRGQDDLRDVVLLTNGQQVQGRVHDRYAPDEVTVMQGGKRVRLARSRIASFDTVRDRCKEFGERRDKLPGNARHRWYLVEWAQSRGLHATAILQALDVVLHEPDHEAARALLGHRRRGGQWLWPHEGGWLSFADLERHHAEWGHPWVLEGEFFVLRCNGGLRRAVDALMDLERFYVLWFDVLGTALKLYEVTGHKMLVQVWADRESFPNWSSTGHPYFKPRVDLGGHLEESSSYTFFADGKAGRPERLFEVATQHLLYRTLAEDPPFGTQKERLCAWGEVGLGQYFDRRLQGPPGLPRLVPWKMPIEAGRLVQAERDYGLEILTHRQARQFFITVADNTPLDWASAHLFVAYLVDEDRSTALREAFLQFLSMALRDGKGESSSGFDRLLGRKVETLEAPWRQWIEAGIQKAQQPP